MQLAVFQAVYIFKVLQASQSPRLSCIRGLPNNGTFRVDGMKNPELHKLPIISLLIFFVLLCSSATISATETEQDIPRKVDAQLQRGLMGHLDQMGLSNAVEQGRLAVSLVDVTDLASPKVAHVNGNTMMYAASLPKIAILFGAFHEMAAGSLKRSARLVEDLTNMIRVSSNEAATRVLNQVGPQKLNQLLQAAPYRFYDINNHGGLWVGKAYGKAPAFQRDPLHAISHGATAMQVARFYYHIENESLISPEASREMKAMLSNPRINHKFVAGLQAVHPESAIFRKSGTWQTYHCDSAIVERDGRRYIAVALANDRNGGEWLKKIIVAVDDIIFTADDRIQASLAN